jgi:hypothetical protein
MVPNVQDSVDDGQLARRAAAGDRGAFRALIEAAAWSDPDTDVQDDALDLLAELADGAGIPMLTKVARTHPNLDLREEAMDELAEMTDDRAKKALRQMAR